jgi:formylglycine-generating enzyme required for sulfatase activity
MDGVTVVGAHPQGDSPLGICDLSGNVWEWVADWYSESYIPVDVRNPKGPVGGTEKVIRGGGWYDDSSRITAIRRMHADLLYRSDDIGFRCASD